jgi:hypothetical protein
VSSEPSDAVAEVCCCYCQWFCEWCLSI